MFEILQKENIAERSYSTLARAEPIAARALAGQFVNLVKDSSLASAISLVELTLVGRQIMTATFAAFESYIAIALFYFSICFVLSLLTKILERKVPVE